MPKNDFEHVANTLNQTDRPLVYTSMSKHLFYMREHISRFVLDNGGVPLNPFMIFNYFLGDTVDRNVVREANNTLVERADQLWHFGPISDGALSEILRAQSNDKLVRCFGVVASKDFIETDFASVELEEEIKDKRALLLGR